MRPGRIPKHLANRPIDVAVLPDWARRDPAVVALCRKDRAYYRDVILADKDVWREALLAMAHKLTDS